MYLLEKKFEVPCGHRLSKHAEKCKNIHGHNFTILTGIYSPTLDDNDMVIDFSEVKRIVNQILEQFDHTLLLNKNDNLVNKIKDIEEYKVIRVSGDPTAESFAELLFNLIAKELPSNITLAYISVYENPNSKITYSPYLEQLMRSLM